MTTSATVPTGTNEATTTTLREPRSTGEVISVAVRALRQHLGVIVAFTLPLCALDLLVREVASGLLFGLGAAAGADLDAIVAAAGRIAGACGLYLASFALQQLINGAVTAVADDDEHGRAVSTKAALLRLLDRGVPLLLTSVLFLVLGGLVVVVALALPLGVAAAAIVGLGIDPLLPSLFGGLGAVILAVIGLVVFTLRYALFSPVVVVEGRAGFAALSRSAALTASRGLGLLSSPRFRLSVVLLIALALSSILQGVFIGPRLVVAVIGGWTPLDGALPGLMQVPAWFAVPFGLVEVVTNAVVIPLAALLSTYFLFDLRVRYEPDAT